MQNSLIYNQLEISILREDFLEYQLVPMADVAFLFKLRKSRSLPNCEGQLLPEDDN